MTRTFLIRHETVYRYRSPVAFGEHRLMLRPRESHDQRTLAWQVEIAPKPQALTWSEDASGNFVGLASFGRRAPQLSVVASATVEVRPARTLDLSLAEHARTCPFSYGHEEMPDLARFIERQAPDPEHAVDRWARSLLAGGGDRDTWGFLLRMTSEIRSEFGYLRREEPGTQAPTVTLRTRRGSCRDFAVLMTEAARSQGLAARFVSGYLHVHSGDERVRRAGGATHAWLQVYLPGAGWVDFDPTSGTVGNADLVRVATVRNPDRAAPLSGTFLGFPSDDIGMTVDVDVRLREAAPLAAVAAA